MPAHTPASVLASRVFAALDQARENGYEEFFRLPAAEVAADLRDYAADLEDESVPELAHLVVAWKASRLATVSERP